MVFVLVNIDNFDIHLVRKSCAIYLIYPLLLSGRWAPFFPGRWAPSFPGRWAPSFTGRFVPSFPGRWAPSFTGRCVPSFPGRWAPSFTGRWVPSFTGRCAGRWAPSFTGRWSPLSLRWAPPWRWLFFLILSKFRLLKTELDLLPFYIHLYISDELYLTAFHSLY